MTTPITPARVEGTLDPVLDALVEVVRTTPQKRHEYMCHGDYHCDYSNDLNTMRKRFAEVLSNQRQHRTGARMTTTDSTTTPARAPGTVPAMVRLKSAFRRWLYRRLCNPFRTMLTQEFLREMLASDTLQLRWTVSLEYDGGIMDALTMTVTCDKVTPNKAIVQTDPN